MFSKHLFKLTGHKQRSPKSKSPVGSFGNLMQKGIMWLVKLASRNWMTRISTVLCFSSLSIYGAILLMPKMEYLPQGNRNLVINILIPPPGLSFDERKAIGEHVYQMNAPYFGKDKDGFPGIKNMFYVGAEQIMLFGAISIHEQRAGELIPLFMRTIFSIPGMYGVSIQAGVFQTGLGRGRTVEINVSGQDLNQIVQAAGMFFGAIKKEIPQAQIRPVPSLELLFPEVLIIPERDRIKAAGMTARDFGVAIDVLMDGREIGEFKQEGQKKIDMVLKASEKDISTPERLYDSLIAIPGGKVVPVSSLSRLRRTSGITQIRHLERQRTVTLEVTPPSSMPLQEAMEIINSKVVKPLSGQGALRGVDIGQSGVADKLSETRKSLQWNFILAAVIAYLLMAALFGNFIYPLIIMFNLPACRPSGGCLGSKWSTC